MVNYREQEMWKCPYCEKEYLKWEDALECSQECSSMEFPEGIDKEVYICEYCKEEYEDEDSAEECEEKHKELRDEWLGRKNLKDAGEHPNQIKLGAIT